MVAVEHLLQQMFDRHHFDGIIHFAAESHVDRSIFGPAEFVRTNINGTFALLECARKNWRPNEGLFHHISTDEVFGSLGREGKFTEHTAYDPRSPYSASKAGADHLVMAYHHTYGLPVVISNCSNNYGPNQFPEKLIPLAIMNILQMRSIPVYGKGENVRDWLHVEDHARAIDLIFHEGIPGRTYNVGGNNEWRNIDLITLLCRLMDEKLGREKGSSEQLIRFVKDRAGHDLRYAIDSSRITAELSWEPVFSFEEGLSRTIDWYMDHPSWMDHVTSGTYKDYYEKQYGRR